MLSFSIDGHSSARPTLSSRSVKAALDRIALLARASEEALREAAERGSADDADALIDRAGERASQVEQLRALDRPHGATASALEAAAPIYGSHDDPEGALANACHDLLATTRLSPDARTLLQRIAATCRPLKATN